MSILITLEKISLAYGLQPLLDNVNLNISSGERVCLIGRNGTGKSSLLKIIDGSIAPDSGKIYLSPGVKIARLEQALPQKSSLTIYEAVAEGLSEIGQLLSHHAQLTQKLTSENIKELEKLQQKMDSLKAWQYDQQIQEILTRLELPAHALISSLSGGWQKRVALAKTLVSKPDLLLLDEPTNHLDLQSILWLEDQLLNFSGAILFITHDRTFLKKLALRILELDRGNLTSWPSDYENFLRRKAELLAAEAKFNHEFDKKLSEEEQWLRQGIKARRTRNEGRVSALKNLRATREERREIHNAKFELNVSNPSGELVLEAENISYQYNEKLIIKNFNIRIMRGNRIGLIGSNGVGKTTLLNLLLGKISPQSGSIKLGTQLKVAYFDQLRSELDPEKNILDNIAEGRSVITINGKDRHIISYLSDFLFTPARLHTPVRALSGGECNRLLLAKLFSLPANVFILDEPTNDLDLETLELLENLLINFKETLLIVSHDRSFLDNVVSSSLVFKGDGIIESYSGGYSDWQERIKEKDISLIKKSVNPAHKNTKKQTSAKQEQLKKKQLNTLTEEIEKLENTQQDLNNIMSESNFYQQSPDFIKQTLKKLDDINVSIAEAYEKWEALEKD